VATNWDFWLLSFKPAVGGRSALRITAPNLYFCRPRWPATAQRAKRILSILLVGVALGYEGCAGTTTVTSGAASSQTLAGPLSLSLKVPAVVPLGQSVPFRLVITNTGKDSVMIGLTGTIGLTGVKGLGTTFAVSRGSKEVWDNVRDATPYRRRIEAYLAPNDSILLQELWRQHDNDQRPVSAGRYTVKAFVLVSHSSQLPDGIARAAVEFGIR
jgi:hypothetical protein